MYRVHVVVVLSALLARVRSMGPSHRALLADRLSVRVVSVVIRSVCASACILVRVLGVSHSHIVTASECTHVDGAVVIAVAGLSVRMQVCLRVALRAVTTAISQLTATALSSCIIFFRHAHHCQSLSSLCIAVAAVRLISTARRKVTVDDAPVSSHIRVRRWWIEQRSVAVWIRRLTDRYRWPVRCVTRTSSVVDRIFNLRKQIFLRLSLSFFSRHLSAVASSSRKVFQRLVRTWPAWQGSGVRVSVQGILAVDWWSWTFARRRGHRSCSASVQG